MSETIQPINYIVVKTTNGTTNVPIGVQAENIEGDITATTIGTNSVGSTVRPIYLNGGIPTECDSDLVNTTYTTADSTHDGLLSYTLYNKLIGIEESANNYSLPNATTTTVGGVSIGDNLSIDENGVLSGAYPTVSDDTDGLMLSTDKQKLDGVADNANNYSLPIATTSDLGGIIIGSGMSISETGICSIDNASGTQNGLMSADFYTKLANIDYNANNYSLPAATAYTLGGVVTSDDYQDTTTSGVAATPTAVRQAYNDLVELIPEPSGDVTLPFISVGDTDCDYETLTEAFADTRNVPVLLFSDIMETITDTSVFEIADKTIIGIKPVTVTILGNDTKTVNIIDSCHIENIAFNNPVYYTNTTANKKVLFRNCTFSSKTNTALVTEEGTTIDPTNYAFAFDETAYVNANIEFDHCIFYGETGLYINTVQTENITLDHCKFKLMPGDPGDSGVTAYYKGYSIYVEEQSEVTSEDNEDTESDTTVDDTDNTEGSDDTDEEESSESEEETTSNISLLSLSCIELGCEVAEDSYEALTIVGNFNVLYGSYGNNLTDLNYSIENS